MTKLKQLRKEAYLSENYLANYLNISKVDYKKLEESEQPIPHQLAEQLTVLYGIPFELINSPLTELDNDKREIQRLINHNKKD